MNNSRKDVYKPSDGELGFTHNGIWITDPFVSECGRFPKAPIKYYGLTAKQVALFEENDSLVQYGLAGFECWDTGGNIQVFARRLDITGKNSHYVMVTPYEDICDLPDLNEDVLVCIYNEAWGCVGIRKAKIEKAMPTDVVDWVNKFCNEADLNPKILEEVAYPEPSYSPSSPYEKSLWKAAE